MMALACLLTCFLFLDSSDQDTLTKFTTMDVDPAASSSHSHYAGRYPAGTANAVTLGKNGVRHVSHL